LLLSGRILDGWRCLKKKSVSTRKRGRYVSYCTLLCDSLLPAPLYCLKYCAIYFISHDHDPLYYCSKILATMRPGPGLVAHVLWRYCMRLASSGVGGVRRARLALLYVGSCVGVLWMMFWMRLASSGVCGGCIGHRVPPEG